MSDDPHSRRSSTNSPYLVSVSEDTRAERRHFAPSAERNAGPILEVLSTRLPGEGRIVELASGTGQHVAAFAAAHPGVTWIPSDPDPGARASVSEWTRDAPNVADPLDLDASRSGWHEALDPPLAGLLAINLVHISPWAATEGLFRGAGLALARDGMVFLYGPYRRDGEHTAGSNVEFEKWLKGLSPEYGVRDMADVAREAERNGLALVEVIPMPANNFSLIFLKTGSKPRA